MLIDSLYKYFTINFRHSLVKITYHEPEELNDDIFIKYLIIFKKWLAVEEVPEDKHKIRNAFISQFKPKDTLRFVLNFFLYI